MDAITSGRYFASTSKQSLKNVLFKIIVEQILSLPFILFVIQNVIYDVVNYHFFVGF